MQPEKIFDRLSEVRLLKNLVDRGSLLFVGEKETVEYLQNFFDKNNQNSHYDYYCLPEQWEKFDCDRDRLLNYQAIIVASINNEHLIFDWLKKELENANISTPVLKLFSDIFVNIVSDRELLQSSDREIVAPKISYAIATTARSGSTVLCEALTSTGIAGFPKEHLRSHSLDLTQNCHFDPVRYLNLVITHKTTDNGVFGTKFISHFFSPIYQNGANFSNVISQFKFIYLIRRDKIAQAASGFIASKTTMWHIESSAKYKDYQAKLDRIEISDADIDNLHAYYQWLIEQEQFWEDFFKQNQISPLILEYEQFVENPEQQVNQVLKYLNIIEDDKVAILNRYQYKLYELAKNLNIFSKDPKIRIKLKTKKLQSNLSTRLIEKYKEKYC